jgi:outer membrane receptor protein involved in Fe transport
MRKFAWVICALLASAAARADSIADEADFRFHRAANLVREGKVEEALGEFLASNRLVRNRNVIFNIARCFEELRHYNEAYRWYTEIVHDEMPEADRQSLADALKRLRPSLALLQVESTPPGATVYIDREDLGARGQTPVTLALPPGKVTAIVELPGFRTHTQSIALAVGRTALLAPALDRIYGQLELAGEPAGFEARIDSGAPLALDRGVALVVPGKHILTISAKGYAEQQLAVDVPADGVARVPFKLLPLPPPAGALVVRANLDGALVRVDGKEAGFTPGVIDNVVVGRHKVEISAEGREPAVANVDVKENERAFVDVKMRYALPRVVAAEKELTRAQDAPASITVITADEIRGFGYTTLAEALSSVRGLYTTNDRGYPTLGVRGFSSPGVYNSRILVLSDGHILNELSLGQGYIGHDFDSDLSGVERIEVVRGPGSVLYGSAAFFAVINVVHKTPPEGAHAEAGGAAGTFGENSGHAIFSVANDTSWGWARASGVNMTGQSFFPNPGNAALIAQGLDNERAGHVDFRARIGDFTLLATYNDRHKDLPTGAYDTIFGAPGTYVHDERGFFEVQYNHAFDGGFTVEGRVAYDGEWYNGQWQYSGTPLGDFGSDLSCENWGTAELRLRLPTFSGHRIFVGGEFQDRWQVDLNAIVPAGSGSPATHWSNFKDGVGAAQPGVPNAELVMSGYAGDDWTITPRLKLDLAVRVDAYHDYQHDFGAGFSGQDPSPAVNPRVALLAQPYDGGYTKVMFGRAFRYPGFYERYYNDGGVSQAAAVNLKPETVYTGEVEHTHQFSDEVSVVVAGYVSEMDNLIFIASPANNISQYQNRPDPVHAVGGEAEIRWQAGPGWLFSAWYAYSHVRQDGANGVSTGFLRGQQVPNSPQNTGALRVLFPFAGPVLAGSTELVYGGARQSFADTGEAPQSIGESLNWNLGVSGEYARGRFGLRYGAFVDNLLDQHPLQPAGPEISFPAHAIPQYGRTIRLQIGASF